MSCSQGVSRESALLREFIDDFADRLLGSYGADAMPGGKDVFPGTGTRMWVVRDVDSASRSQIVGIEPRLSDGGA